MEDLIKFVQGLVPDRIKPFVNALVAAIAVLLALTKLVDPLSAMRSGRRRSLAARQRLEEAAAATTFWEAWFKTSQLVNPADQVASARERVQRELQLILDRLEEPLRSARTGRHLLLPGRSFLRRAFLLYRPSGLAGWLLHLGFYFFLAIFSLFVLGISIDPVSKEMSARYLFAHFGANLAPTLIVLVPLVWLQLAASRRDRKQPAALEQIQTAHG